MKTAIVSIFLFAIALAVVSCGTNPDADTPAKVPDLTREPAATTPDEPTPAGDERWLQPASTLTADGMPENWKWDAHPEMVKDDDAVAVIGATKITRAAFFEKLEKDHANVLDSLIDQTIREQIAKKIGLTLTDEEISGYAEKLVKDRIEEQRRLMMRQGVSFDEYVKNQTGKTVEEYQKDAVKQRIESGSARRLLLASRLVAFDKLTHRRIRIRHIQYSSEKDAIEAIGRIKKDRGTFPAIARNESDDPITRQTGGELAAIEKDDWEFRDDLKKFGSEFFALVMDLPRGLADKPLKSKAGWHVVEMLEAQTGRSVKYGEVADEVKTLLDSGLTHEDYILWPQRIRHRSKVEKFEDAKDGLMATVNGQKITRADFREFLTKHFGMNTAMELVALELVKARAKEIGVKHTPEEISKMSEQIADVFIADQRRQLYEQYPQYRGSDIFADYVRQQMGKSFAEYRAELIEQRIQDGSAERELATAKVACHYLFSTAHTVVQQIRFQNVQHAKSAWYKLEGGADFSLLAKEMSQDRQPLNPDYKIGEMLPIARAEYPYRDDMRRIGPIFVNVALNTAKGRVSGAFKSEMGWHIIKVLDRWESNPAATYDSLKDRINKEIFEGRDSRWMLFRVVFFKTEAQNKRVAIKMPTKFD